MSAAGETIKRAEGPEAPFPYRAWWGLLACAVFMGLIFLFAPYSNDQVFPPDKGNMWYLWQRADATWWTRLSAWLPYTLHTLGIWYLITQARKERPRYIWGLHRFNVLALALNGFFMLLHIAQTKIFYDGLAQDVHEATSMMSVILMLLLILLMENRRRGLFFGKGVSFLNNVGDTVRRYHGYYFSWAIIYVFWYHPIEMTSGHLAGFAYMSLLILQSSLFFTRYHVNRWWTMSLEVLFVIHGALVAYFILQQGQSGPWSAFLFGGMGIFLITQMHGLGLSTKGKIAVATPIVAVMATYYAINPQDLSAFWRIPAIMYLGTFLMFIICWLLIRFASLFTPPEPRQKAPA